MFMDLESKALDSLSQREAEDTSNNEDKDTSNTDEEDTSNEGEETENENEEDGGEEQDDSDGDSDDEDGYSADDLEEDDDEGGKQSPQQEQKVDPSQLDPKNSFIYENLPTLTVYDSEGKAHNVKTPYELPGWATGDFEFAKGEERKFNLAVASQERKAEDLAGRFEQQENSRKADEWRQQEARDIQGDLADLQREGVIPKFKARPDEPGFDKDPTVQEVQKYIDYYEKRNTEYMKSGKAYRISFKDAVQLYKSQNTTKSDTGKLKGDDERKNASRKTSARSQGAKAKEADNRRRFAPGTGIQDILDYHLTKMD